MQSKPESLSQSRLKRWLSLTVDIWCEITGKTGKVEIALPKDVGDVLIDEGVLFEREGSVWFIHLDGTAVEVILGGNDFVINIIEI